MEGDFTQSQSQVINPITHGVAGQRYTDYECRLKVSKMFFFYRIFPGGKRLSSKCFLFRQTSLCSEWKSRVFGDDSLTLNGWGTSWRGTARSWCPPCPARPSSASFPSAETTVICHILKSLLYYLLPLAGIFEEDFIEERRAGLEGFINKIAGHPLAQNERCLHMFLQVFSASISQPLQQH